MAALTMAMEFQSFPRLHPTAVRFRTYFLILWLVLDRTVHTRGRDCQAAIPLLRNAESITTEEKHCMARKRYNLSQWTRGDAGIHESGLR